tara:strand:+ start:87 stop:320 length:234 start_codon:yes stop_codon:yes gene_type:complete
MKTKEIAMKATNRDPEIRKARLLKVDEVAEIIGLGRTKVYDLVATGQMPSVKIDSARRIPLTALEDFVSGLSSPSVK